MQKDIQKYFVSQTKQAFKAAQRIQLYVFRDPTGEKAILSTGCWTAFMTWEEVETITGLAGQLAKNEPDSVYWFTEGSYQKAGVTFAKWLTTFEGIPTEVDFNYQDSGLRTNTGIILQPKGHAEFAPLVFAEKYLKFWLEFCTNKPYAWGIGLTDQEDWPHSFVVNLESATKQDEPTFMLLPLRHKLERLSIVGSV